jgi:hypothetical protein
MSSLTCPAELPFISGGKNRKRSAIPIVPHHCDLFYICSRCPRTNPAPPISCCGHVLSCNASLLSMFSMFALCDFSGPFCFERSVHEKRGRQFDCRSPRTSSQRCLVSLGIPANTCLHLNLLKTHRKSALKFLKQTDPGNGIFRESGFRFRLKWFISRASLDFLNSRRNDSESDKV